MNQTTPLAISAIIVCTLLNSCFSMAETALVSMSSSRLQHLHADEEDGEKPLPSADSIRWLLAEPTKIVAAVQIGLTVFSLTSAAIATALLAPDFAVWLYRHGVAHSVRVSVISLVIVVAILTLVVGEIVPRAIARRYPERVALLVATPLRWVERIERPIVALILGLSNLLVRPFGMTASFNTPVITESELRTMLEASQKEGVIQEDEKEMLHNVISFGDTLVHKVMTPRVHVKAIEVKQSLDKLVNLIVDHGHSRIPVYQNTIDSIIGIIHAKDLLPSLGRGHRIEEIRSVMRDPFFVPKQMRTDELLDEMRRSNMQLAIVQDEYGGTAGLVTIEDLLEEIVGEIQDEYDVEEPRLTLDESGGSVVDARMDIDEVNEELGLQLPTTDFDTVGGLVFGLFGRPPAVGDRITTLDGPDDDTEVGFTVVKADGRRLQLIKIETRPYVPQDESSTAVQAADI